MDAQIVHERTQDGRERHYMQKVDGFWRCECGEVRDIYGRPVIAINPAS